MEECERCNHERDDDVMMTANLLGSKERICELCWTDITSVLETTAEIKERKAKKA